jgi:small-conductance mechanosensitive channel
MSFTANRLVRRKLRLSLILLGAFVASDLAVIFYGGRVSNSEETIAQIGAFARLAIAAAIINAAVVLLINPLKEDRIPDRFPSILQDGIVIGLVLLASTFLSQQLLTTSAVSAVVLGFALQDTLGNAFAGLAIQSEKPFKVGHWIKVGEFEGRVAEVTWRATKLRSKSGNLLVLPNNVVSKEPVTNYSEPATPLRLTVDVGASYLVPPNQVKAAMMEAMRHCNHVIEAPAPEALLLAFDASAITYRARFWIDDFAADEVARDEVRTAIYYAFQRHGIEIPWPIQVEYQRELKEPDRDARDREEAKMLERIDLFAGLTPDLRLEVARSAPRVVFGSGETIVRQGEAGGSMFVIMAGTVSVMLAPSRTEVARIEAGGYFGEMSVLTGDPRTATVIALGDVEAIEIGADLFRRLAEVEPQAVEQIAVLAATRRMGLEAARTAAASVATVEHATLVSRMKKFLRIK